MPQAFLSDQSIRKVLDVVDGASSVDADLTVAPQRNIHLLQFKFAPFATTVTFALFYQDRLEPKVSAEFTAGKIGHLHLPQRRNYLKSVLTFVSLTLALTVRTKYLRPTETRLGDFEFVSAFERTLNAKRFFQK